VKLDLLSRVRARAGRGFARVVFGVPVLRAWLRSTRRRDVARGLDPDVAVMLAGGEMIGQTGASIGTPDRERREFAVSVAMADVPPPGDVEVRDVRIPGAGATLEARLYAPRGLEAIAPGLVFVHGGGWVVGDLDTHDGLCRRFALTGRMRVLSVAPRLAPEHPFPAAVDDSIAAFRHVASRARELGFDPNGLGIAGDSAGGNLSAVVCLATRADAVRPRVAVLVYPAVDATRSQPSHRSLGRGFFLTEASIVWYLAQYLGRDEALETNPRVSPLHEPDLRGAPDTLVVVAGFDPLRDEGLLYAKRLEDAGARVEVLRYDALPHGFALMTRLSRESLRATEEVARRAGELLRRAARHATEREAG
jgi:acetyl esterase